MNFKPGIITQARMGSTRLPGKIFLTAGNKTLLEHHVDRISWSGYDATIACTEDPKDDEIFLFCKKKELNCYRDDEKNVLKRFYETAKYFKFDPVVRVTSDCPLIDGNLIRQGIEAWKEAGDGTYVSNVTDRSFPRGFDFEVFSFAMLEDAFKNAKTGPQREHVTPYIREIAKNILHIKHHEDASRFRLTVDEKEDHELIKKIIEEYNADIMSAEEIIELMMRSPELESINKHIRQKET